MKLAIYLSKLQSGRFSPSQVAKKHSKKAKFSCSDMQNLPTDYQEKLGSGA
jgi:hypothetical protein